MHLVGYAWKYILASLLSHLQAATRKVFLPVEYQNNSFWVAAWRWLNKEPKTFFNFQGFVHREYIPFDIFPRCNVTQFIYLWKAALHVWGFIYTHHQEHTELYLRYLVFVKPLLLPASTVEELELTIEAGSSNGLTDTRYCKYSSVCSWWWVEIPPKTCREIFQK